MPTSNAKLSTLQSFNFCSTTLLPHRNKLGPCTAIMFFFPTKSRHLQNPSQKGISQRNKCTYIQRSKGVANNLWYVTPIQLPKVLGGFCNRFWTYSFSCHRSSNHALRLLFKSNMCYIPCQTSTHTGQISCHIHAEILGTAVGFDSIWWYNLRMK